MPQIHCPVCRHAIELVDQQQQSAGACPQCHTQVSVPAGVQMPPLPPPLPAASPIPAAQPPSRSAPSLTCLVLAVAIPVVAIMLVFVIGIMAAILLPALARARESARRASCQNNLKQMGLVFKMWKNEAEDGYYPPLSSEAGRFCFPAHEVYPDYLTDPVVMLCPSDVEAPERNALSPEALIDDHSYFYLGYALTSEEEGLAFLEAYEAQISEGGDFSGALPAAPGTGTGGGDAFLRLGPNLQAELEAHNGSSVSPAEIPVMFDSTHSKRTVSAEFFNHIPGGMNVLYLDGHTEFLRFPGDFPASREFLDALAALE